jgi:RND family efflux transporter MFP subunit
VQLRLAQSEKTLENMVIRAPGAGIVIYGDARRPFDDREIKVGEMVYSGQPFITLPDLTEMQVVVAVHEADVARVRDGQKAFITVETSRSRPVAGTVTRVAPVATSQGRRWYDQTKRFDVELVLEGDITGMHLKPGLTANVEILLEELTDALAVPAQSVFSQRGKFHVFRKRGGTAERVEVEIASGNAQYVVVTAGLAEGDEIFLYNPEAVTEDGATADEPGAAPEPAEAVENGAEKTGGGRGRKP